jgi:hypothetical protein
VAQIKSSSVKSALTTWFLLFGLLLHAVVWTMPANRAGQAEWLAHEMAHAIDHGHHHHDTHAEALGHDVDPALYLDAHLDHAADDRTHGPHHLHAGENLQFQGLPEEAVLPARDLPRIAPRIWSPDQPPSADLAGPLRPPQHLS